MRRVSSHATTSASRRAESTRSVTSSRFPIGVGQTTSRPPLMQTPPAARRRPRGPPAPRPPGPPRLRRPPPRSAPTSRPGASARSPHHLRAGSSSSSPAALTPPPITTTCGLKMFTSDTSPMPSALADQRDRVARHRVALLGELGDQRPGQLAPFLERVPERGVGPPRHGQGRQPHERRARAAPSPGSRSWGSRTGTAARSCRRPCAPSRRRRRSSRGRPRRPAAGRRRYRCRW